LDVVNNPKDIQVALEYLSGDFEQCLSLLRVIFASGDDGVEVSHYVARLLLYRVDQARVPDITLLAVQCHRFKLYCRQQDVETAGVSFDLCPKLVDIPFLA
jgi:hypothetical protein